MHRTIKRRSKTAAWAVLASAVLLGLPAAAQAVAPAGTDRETPYAGATEIVVTAPRLEVPFAENPAATTVVGEDELQAMPRGIAADEALKLVPSVKIDNQADGERVHLSIRGQGILTERGVRGITVLLDGIPLNDPTGFAPDLFDVDWAIVDRVEVYRGPASALFGGASSGGVIAVSTEDGGPKTSGGSAYGGSHGFWKVQGQVGEKSGPWSYHLSASRTMGDGYRDHTAFAATNVYGKSTWKIGEAGSVTAILAATSFFNENAEGLNVDWLREDRRQANPDAGVFNEYQKTRRVTLGATGFFNVGEGQDLRFALYGRRWKYREAVPSSVQHRTYEAPGGYLQWALHAGSGTVKNHLMLGADFQWQDIDEIKHPNLGHAVEGPEILADQNIRQSGTGVYLLDRLQLTPRWSVMAGVRHDAITNKLTDHLATPVNLSGKADFSRTTSRIGVAFVPRDDFSAYAAWGQGFLPPATEELANNPAQQGGFNGSLKPATSQGPEIGVRGRVGSQFTYDLALFHLATKNDFGRYRIASRPLETFYGNEGSTDRNGLEALLGWFPTESLALRMAYTYSDFTYDHVTFQDAFYRGTRLPNIPKHQGYLDAAWQIDTHWEAGVSMEVQSRSYVDPSNLPYTGGYTLYHARLAYAWKVKQGGEGRVMLSGRNLTGKQTIAFTEPDPDGNSYQPAPEREVFLGLQFRF